MSAPCAAAEALTRPPHLLLCGRSFGGEGGGGGLVAAGSESRIAPPKPCGRADQEQPGDDRSQSRRPSHPSDPRSDVGPLAKRRTWDLGAARVERCPAWSPPAAASSASALCLFWDGMPCDGRLFSLQDNRRNHQTKQLGHRSSHRGRCWPSQAGADAVSCAVPLTL